MEIDYFEKGYFLAKKVFEPNRIELIIQDINTVFQNFTSQNNSLDDNCKNLFSANFEDFVVCAKASSNLLSIYNIFCGNEILTTLRKLKLKTPSFNTPPIIHFSSKLTAKKESYWKVPAHQDWHSNQGIINGNTCWLTLQDTNISLGALQVLPGSHLDGPLPHYQEDIPILNQKIHDGFQDIEMNIGDVLFFNTFLIHRSGDNVTDSIRFSIAARYNDLTESTYVQRKFPKPPPLENRVSNNKFPSKEQIKKTLCG
jgi:ectoine hydroxylase-related dioxygenase (phytanoyl-CoA dioxygenase family)